MSDEQKKIEDQITDQLEINPTEVMNELLEQPARFFYWGSLWARASRKKRGTKLALKEKEAKLTADFRINLAETDPTTRVTENMIKTYLGNHPDMTTLETTVIKDEFIEEELAVAKDAMKQRHQVLLEISRMQNEEKFYGNEYRNMRNELETREIKTRKKRTKVEPVVDAVVEE
jgi:hypothetical protein